MEWFGAKRRFETLGLPELDPQLYEQALEVGFVDEHFSGWLARGRGLNGAFIERPKKAHLGDGVFLATGKRAAVLLRPGVQRGLRDENFKGERRAPVRGDDVGKFATGIAAPLGTIPFKEVVLINVAVGSRVALDATDGIGARHGGIIGGAAVEVNAGICGGCSSTMKQPSAFRFQFRTKFGRCETRETFFRSDRASYSQFWPAGNLLIL